MYRHGVTMALYYAIIALQVRTVISIVGEYNKLNILIYIQYLIANYTPSNLFLLDRSFEYVEVRLNSLVLCFVHKEMFLCLNKLVCLHKEFCYSRRLW